MEIPSTKASSSTLSVLSAYDHVCAHETADYIRKYNKDDFDPGLIKLACHAVDRSKPLNTVFVLLIIYKDS